MGVGLLDVAGVLLRRWYLTLAGLALVVGVSWHVAHPQPTYWASSEVSLLLPPGQKTPTVFQGTESLIAAAGVVASQLNGQNSATRTSDDIALIGFGVKHGYSITLPNSGGQWANNFDRPALVVQAVGSSPEEVRGSFRAGVDAITSTLSRREDAAKVPDEGKIRLQTVPANPQVIRDSGHSSQALVTGLVLGLGVVVAFVLAVDRRLLRRRTVKATPPVRRPEPVPA